MTQAELSLDTIVARVERLPVSRWHAFMRVVMGSATFFDAFDSLAIAFFGTETRGQLLETLSP